MIRSWGDRTRRGYDLAGTLIDATAVPRDRGGVGRYVDALIQHAAVIERSGDHLLVACQARDAEHYRRLAPGARVLAQSPLITSTVVRMLWEQLVLPLIARRTCVAVIHSPHYTVPILTRVARVVTFHDATFFSDPLVHTPVKRLFFRAWMRLSSRLARQIVTPSEATREEVLRYVVAANRRVVVIHHGVDASVFRPPTHEELAYTANHLHLDGTWISFVGTLEPRKNVPALVRAYVAWVGGLGADAGQVPQLILIGAAGWEEDLDAELARVHLPAVVLRPGFVPTDHLRSLLGGAELVVYPSLGEGFGLPVLEAMACRAPVLTTRRLSLPEIGGSAVAYSDVDDESIASAMTALMSDPKERDRLATAGYFRSREFTWEASAKQHSGVYAAARKAGRRRE